MPVSLFTGLPGAGKTAWLVKRIVELSEKEPGRPIFYVGIKGLKAGLATELTMEQLEKWWDDLPQGSIIAIDECQDDHLMPKDRGSPSPWVQKITKVRHYGMDFLLTTQHPANMSAYVRRLVDLHVHSVMRAKGVRQTFTWMRCIDDPDNRREKKFADISFSPLPKEVFDLYKSSSLHTMKVRTPRMVYMLIAMVVALLCIVPYVMYRVHDHAKPSVAQSKATASSTDIAKASDVLRSQNFPKWSQARVPGVPWSAPMFDKLEVKAEPRLYCIATDYHCLCETEQGTRFAVAQGTCREIVANGLYNPFIDGQKPQGADKDKDQDHPAGREEAASPPPARRDDLADAETATKATSWHKSPLRSDYVPPELVPQPEAIKSGTGM